MTIQPARHQCHACCLLRAGFLAFQLVVDNTRGTRVEQVISSFQKILRGSQLTWYSDVCKRRDKRNLVTFFVNKCVFAAMPREGSGKVWRQEKVPAFPPEPSSTQPTRCCQHTLVYKKKALDFVWTVTYGHQCMLKRLLKAIP